MSTITFQNLSLADRDASPPMLWPLFRSAPLSGYALIFYMMSASVSRMSVLKPLEITITYTSLVYLLFASFNCSSTSCEKWGIGKGSGYSTESQLLTEGRLHVSRVESEESSAVNITFTVACSLGRSLMSVRLHN
ncbi:hypothetical protein XENOCAPTIV_013500 [Xenoophorus captivus]|uniref:Uncharacterized protein n=1 Tax=Xenoophorus captivus TaxID=1517983 RepID=A0ABV0Q9U2_9TELE